MPISIQISRYPLATLAVLLCGCHGSAPVSSMPSVCSDLAAAEAAFVSHLFSHNRSTVGHRAAAVFVEMPGGADPAGGFLARITDVPARLAPASEAAIDDTGRVRDPVTGAPALLVRIIEARLSGQARAEIRGGYQEAPLSASRAAYELRCEEGSWRVIGHGPMKIS